MRLPNDLPPDQWSNGADWQTNLTSEVPIGRLGLDNYVQQVSAEDTQLPR